MNKIGVVTGTVIVIIATIGITNYVNDYNNMAKITMIKPYMISKKTPYQECTDSNHTTYTKPGDKAGVIGGVAGGVGGAAVAYAITTNPVVLAGGAIAGVIGGQAIERHVNKPKAHTHTVLRCETKYKDEQIQNGYLVSFTYKGIPDQRVLQTKPLEDKINIAILKSAPTKEQLDNKNNTAADSATSTN